MSLRSFHIVFICTAMAFLAFFTVWVGRQAALGRAEFALLGFASGAGLAAGIPYLAWFLSKRPPLIAGVSGGDGSRRANAR